jgi:hypothetical protein
MSDRELRMYCIDEAIRFVASTNNYTDINDLITIATTIESYITAGPVVSQS